MSYAVTLHPAATRAVEAIDDKGLRRRIAARIDALAENPRPPGCSKLRGYENRWRVRVGDHRILYTVDDGALRVLVIEVGNRREVYR